jgi:hypothetical protein
LKERCAGTVKFDSYSLLAVAGVGFGRAPPSANREKSIEESEKSIGTKEKGSGETGAL